MKSFAYLSGAGFGFLGVALGAFGAHALEATLVANGHEDTYATATLYHLVHAGLLVLLGLVAEKGMGTWLRIAIVAAATGIVLFSGSLYLYSTLDLRPLAMVTPFGGVGFLVAWLSLFVHVLQRNAKQ